MLFCLRSFCRYFCPSPGSLWVRTKPSSTIGNRGYTVGWCSLQLKQDNKEEYFGKMAELFKERLCKLVQNYRNIYDTSPGTGTDNSNRTAWKEEIGQEMNIS